MTIFDDFPWIKFLIRISQENIHKILENLSEFLVINGYLFPHILTGTNDGDYDHGHDSKNNLNLHFLITKEGRHFFNDYFLPSPSFLPFFFFLFYILVMVILYCWPFNSPKAVFIVFRILGSIFLNKPLSCSSSASHSPY